MYSMCQLEKKNHLFLATIVSVNVHLGVSCGSSLLRAITWAEHSATNKEGRALHVQAPVLMKLCNVYVL